MPYGSSKDLPPNVKKLSEHKKKVWRAAFNSAYQQSDGDEEKAFAVAWSAANKIKDADWDEDKHQRGEGGKFASGSGGGGKKGDDDSGEAMSLAEAGDLTELDPGDIEHFIEEEGRVDTDTHTIFPGEQEGIVMVRKQKTKDSVMRRKPVSDKRPAFLEEDDDDEEDEDDDSIGDARTVQLSDSVELIDGSVRKTKDGYLVADARIARTGIQIYSGQEIGVPSMAQVRVYRPPSEVFSKKAMQSLANMPITLTHPPQMVDAKSWKEYAVGHTGDEVARDGEFVRVPLVLMDSKAVDAYQRYGVSELSVGYGTELKWGKGRTPAGEIYDAKQTAIRGNHLAVVPAARGGSLLRIGDDKQGGTDMVRILIDGQTIEFADDLAAKHVQGHVSALQTKLADAEKKIKDFDADDIEEEEKKKRMEADSAAKTGEIAALKKQLEDANAKLTGKALDEIVKERTDLLLKANAAMDGKANFDGKEPAEVRRIVVDAKLGDAAKGLTDNEVVGAFKALTANVKLQSGVDKLTDSLSQLQHSGGQNDPKAIKDAAYGEMVKGLTNAWRTPRAS